ncbi:MAG: hypothetical protein R3C32_11610 [Chloroflexota bacterium]
MPAPGLVDAAARAVGARWPRDIGRGVPGATSVPGRDPRRLRSRDPGRHSPTITLRSGRAPRRSSTASLDIDVVAAVGTLAGIRRR